MAEFALGLTKTAVMTTVNMVKSAMEDEAKLRVLVQDDLVFITGEFQMMQSFLSASGAGRRASQNQVVRTWVRQLRDLAFDVEDCVEFVIHLDKASRWDWVDRLASSVMVCTARRLLPLDLAVGEIKRLKARMEDISQRNSRYNLITGDDSPADVGQQLGTSSATSSKAVARAGAFQALKDVWKASGKLGDHTAVDLERLINSLVSELQVISLLCGGQVADLSDNAPNNYAHTVKKVFDHPEVCKRFKNRACVKLSVHHPFNPVEFVDSLLTQFRSRHGHSKDDDQHQHNHANGNGSSISELLLELSEHRFLVVIEQELTAFADWDAIRICLPDGNNGSRVVVSTKNLGIALACTGDPYQVSEIIPFSHHGGLYALFPKCLGNRIGVGEVIWQLRQDHILYLFSEDTLRFKEEWWYDDRVLAAGQFEGLVHYSEGQCHLDGNCVVNAETEGEKFKLFNFAVSLVVASYTEDEDQLLWRQKLHEISEEDITEWCRERLTEKDYLILGNVKDLIKVPCFDELDRLGEGRGSIEQEEADQCELIGRENFLGYLRQSPCVVPLWGIAGVGKTAIAREFYDHRSNEEDWTIHGWVDLPYPFHLTEVCRRLLLDFYSGNFAAQESAVLAMMEGHDPIQWCCNILRQNCCLLVFDGLRSTHDWDMIKAALLYEAHAKGRTIVTTREEIIAEHCSVGVMLNVRCLESDVALDLFNKIASQYDQEFESRLERKMIYKLLISKCGGLPEVIVALAKKVHSYPMKLLKIINSDFCPNMQIHTEHPTLRDLFCWMQSYLDACSDELKPCIFYISVFLTEQVVRRKRLIRRWIAEGYSSGDGGTRRSMDKNSSCSSRG
ncbi:hypothetical protein ACQ4PT_047006 [Festuca glaucescens]